MKAKKNKYRVILDRAFQKVKLDSDREWLQKFNDHLKAGNSLSMRQVIVLVRIARKLKAYYPSSRSSLNERLRVKTQRIKKSREKNQIALESAPVIIRKKSI